MPKPSFSVGFIPCRGDLKEMGQAELSMKSLLGHHPDAVTLILFEGLEGDGVRPLVQQPPGLEFLAGPPLGNALENFPLITRLAGLVHAAGIPLRMESVLVPSSTGPSTAPPGAAGYFHLTQFMLAQARVASQLRAGSLILGGLWGGGTPPWEGEQLRAILGAVKTLFHGKILFSLSLRALQQGFLPPATDGWCLSGPFIFPSRSPSPSEILLSRSARAWARQVGEKRPSPGLAIHVIGVASAQGPGDPKIHLREALALLAGFQDKPWFKGLELMAWSSAFAAQEPGDLSPPGQGLLPLLLSQARSLKGRAYSRRRLSR